MALPRRNGEAEEVMSPSWSFKFTRTTEGVVIGWKMHDVRGCPSTTLSVVLASALSVLWLDFWVPETVGICRTDR